MLGLLAVTLLSASLACASTPSGNASDQTRDGALAADQGFWEEAEFRWLKALAIGRRNARALNNLAVRAEREGEFEEAREHYDRALELASTPERFYVERNLAQFEPIWTRINNGEIGSADETPPGGAEEAEVSETGDSTEARMVLLTTDAPAAPAPDAGAGVGSLEILIAVPDQGPNLAGFDRILVGNFVARENSETNLNDFAVRYFRRRITQRTFFETQDALTSAADPELRAANVFDNADYWIGEAADVQADLILTGELGLATKQESQMVRERIRSPDGEVREVARFQDNTVYSVVFDYVLLRGEDGERLLDGTLEAEQAFPAEEGIAQSEAVFETLELLLPKLLDTVTPRRSEQSRYLIY